MKSSASEPGLKCNLDFRGREVDWTSSSQNLLLTCMLVSVNDFNLEDNLPIGPVLTGRKLYLSQTPGCP